MAQAPPGARQYYDGYWFSPPIIADPLANWQPHKPPWQFCHNESYLGNSWRAALLDEVKKGVTQLAKQGLAKPDVMVTNSNGDINVELTQLRSQIAQGCDVIISFPGSATGLCSAIEEAAAKGILFIAINSQVSCRGALNVAQNPYYYGKYEGDWIAKEMGGKGNIVIINGQPGVSVTIAKRQGMLDAMKPYPNIKVSGDLYGMWTPAVAKSEMLKYLATHPEPVDAVWSSGQMSVAGGEALEQAGRPLPKIIADGTNMCSYMAYWKDHDLDGFTLAGRRRADGFRRPPGGDPRHVGSEAEGEHDLYADPGDHQRQLQGLLQARHDGAGHLLGRPAGRAPGAGRLFRPVLHRRAAAAEDFALSPNSASPWIQP